MLTTSSFPVGKFTPHSIDQAIRADWPFYKMKVGDYLYVSTAEMRTRAMAAANHYRKTRGFQFKSKCMGTVYRIWRES